MDELLHYQRHTLLLVAGRKNALEDLSAASFFSYKTVRRLTNFQQIVTKIKNYKI